MDPVRLIVYSDYLRHWRYNAAGRLELFEAKWTELPAAADAVNLEFVRTVVGTAHVAAGAIVCRPPNRFPLGGGFRAVPVDDLG